MSQPLQLATRNLIVNEDEHLTTAFERENFPLNAIPTNCILDKTLPGLGATYSEIKAARNSIIIEPNVPVIIGKTEGDKNLLAVYEGCKDKTIEHYLLDKRIKYKKILCTPESYVKVTKVALDNDINLYPDYFCLYDECEKITQDIDYREAIAFPMNDFFLYANKAFVSATPLDLKNPQFAAQGFILLKVQPTYDYIKDINLIATNNYEISVINLLESLKESECICVFMNSTNGINKLINHLIKKEITDYKAFCSKKSRLKFKERDIISYDTLDLPLAKYNFFTSRFFSAVDIYTDKCPDIIILTDLNEANHSKIDPFTNTIQIYGRFRRKGTDGRKFNSLTHISNYAMSDNVLDEVEIKSYIDTSEKIYRQFKEEITKTTEKGAKQALIDCLKGCSYNQFIDEDGAKNYFKIDNFYNTERVKSYYTSHETLYSAYERTGHFRITRSEVIYAVTDTNRLQYKQLPSKLQRRKFLITKLEALRNSPQISPEDLQREKNSLLMFGDWKMQQDNEYSIQAYELLGFKAIEAVQFYKTDIDRLLIKAKKEVGAKKMFSKAVREAILKRFPENNTYKEVALLEGLTDIFNIYGVTHKVNLNTVKKYYGVRQKKGKNSKGDIRLDCFEPDFELD